MARKRQSRRPARGPPEIGQRRDGGHPARRFTSARRRRSSERTLGNRHTGVAVRVGCRRECRRGCRRRCRRVCFRRCRLRRGRGHHSVIIRFRCGARHHSRKRRRGTSRTRRSVVDDVVVVFLVPLRPRVGTLGDVGTLRDVGTLGPLARERSRDDRAHLPRVRLAGEPSKELPRDAFLFGSSGAGGRRSRRSPRSRHALQGKEQTFQHHAEDRLRGVARGRRVGFAADSPGVVVSSPRGRCLLSSSPRGVRRAASRLGPTLEVAAVAHAARLAAIHNVVVSGVVARAETRDAYAALLARLAGSASVGDRTRHPHSCARRAGGRGGAKVREVRVVAAGVVTGDDRLTHVRQRRLCGSGMGARDARGEEVRGRGRRAGAGGERREGARLRRGSESRRRKRTGGVRAEPVTVNHPRRREAIARARHRRRRAIRPARAGR